MGISVVQQMCSKITHKKSYSTKFVQVVRLCDGIKIGPQKIQQKMNLKQINETEKNLSSQLNFT